VRHLSWHQVLHVQLDAPVYCLDWHGRSTSRSQHHKLSIRSSLESNRAQVLCWSYWTSWWLCSWFLWSFFRLCLFLLLLLFHGICYRLSLVLSLARFSLFGLSLRLLLLLIYTLRFLACLIVLITLQLLLILLFFLFQLIFNCCFKAFLLLFRLWLWCNFYFFLLLGYKLWAAIWLIKKRLCIVFCLSLSLICFFICCRWYILCKIYSVLLWHIELSIRILAHLHLSWNRCHILLLLLWL